MKIVKGTSIKGKYGVCINPREGVLSSEYIFEKYFSRVLNHLSETEYCLKKDSLYIYSSPPRINSFFCRGCTQTQSIIDLNLKLPHNESVYHDNVTLIRRICSNSLKLNLNGNHFGEYCSKMNIMSCSDITHKSYFSDNNVLVFSLLEEKGILKPIIRNTQGVEKKIKITLGTDPEFEVKKNEKTIPAYELIIVSRGEREIIGMDGSEDQKELRPTHSKNPSILISNIKDLIKTCHFLGEELYIEGKKYSLGGHIHIGGISKDNGIIELLDYFLHPLSTLNGEVRKESDYGREGDYREKDYGIEYRTPPSGWLGTPKLAKMTLSIVKRLSELHYSNEDIKITDEYIEDLVSIGFKRSWAISFLKEIEYVKNNMNKPLSKLWNVEIPNEYRIRKTLS